MKTKTENKTLKSSYFDVKNKGNFQVEIEKILFFFLFFFISVIVVDRLLVEAMKSLDRFASIKLVG